MSATLRSVTVNADKKKKSTESQHTDVNTAVAVLFIMLQSIIDLKWCCYCLSIILPRLFFYGSRTQFIFKRTVPAR